MQLFEQINPTVHINTRFSSDKHPYYKHIVRRYYPNATYRQVKGSKACVAGQGDNINRLIRKTWYTTKDPVMLMHHLYVYMRFMILG